MSEKEEFHFTVGQLIEVLKYLLQDLPLLTSGYENGFEKFNPLDIDKMKHEPECMYYDSEFQDGRGTFGVAVLRKVGL